MRIVHLLCSLVVFIFIVCTSSPSPGGLLAVDALVIFVMDQASANSCGFARICVFCGSSSGKKPIYTEVAQDLGSEMVKRGIDLVYGGGSIGLMGATAKAVQDAGGHVVGVIPKALMPKEICGATVGDLVAVDDMHQRKAEMARRADAFIALPGGFGTFEEVLEIITWAQLGIHKKPVGLLNVDGYYDAMLVSFDKALDQGFLNVASRNIVVHAHTAAALLDNLKNYSPIVDKTVPELTWATTTGVSASSKRNVTSTGIDIEAAYDPDFHMINQICSARGARVSSIKSSVATRNGAHGMNLMQIGARRRRSYGVHAQPSHLSIDIGGLFGSVTMATKFNAPIRALAAFL